MKDPDEFIRITPEDLKKTMDWFVSDEFLRIIKIVEKEGYNKAKRELEAINEENKKLKDALELIAMPIRSDGTYNRSREACEQLAREALKGEK
jgi:hypothetical protein